VVEAGVVVEAVVEAVLVGSVFGAAATAKVLSALPADRLSLPPSVATDALCLEAACAGVAGGGELD
jgi:hypothetical protein